MKVFNIIVCGIGGTGVIGLGTLLKNAALPEGIGVVGSETRGSAQRGGAVTSSVRYLLRESKSESADFSGYWMGMIPVGGADLMIATEAAESLRNILYLSEKTRIVLNTFAVPPKPASKAKQKRAVNYPSISDISDNLKQITPHVRVVDASKMSMERFGSYLLTNPILLGVALADVHLPVKKETLNDLLTRGRQREALEMGHALY